MIQGLYTLLVSAQILILAAYRSPGPPPAPERKGALAKPGGLRFVLQAELLEGGEQISPTILEMTRATLEKRALELGVPEPAIRVAGMNQIIAQLPLATDMEEIGTALTQHGYLELADGGSDPPTVGTLIAADAESASDATWPIVISMADIDGATALLAQFAGMPLVRFSLKAEGREKLADFTTRNPGSHMLVVLDKRVICAPRVYDPIASGVAEIVGMTFWEAARIAAQLKSGTLPVLLSIVEAVEAQQI